MLALLYPFTRLILSISLLLTPIVSNSPPQMPKSQGEDVQLVLTNEELSLTLYGGMVFTLDDRIGQHLLFPGPTSVINFRIDGEVITPARSPNLTIPVQLDDTTAQETYTTEEGLELTVIYQLVGPAVQISMHVANSTGVSHQVEARILLDTQVDDNDGSPLWVGGQVYTHEHELQPPFSLAKGYDRIPEPGLTTTLTFQSQPERVLFVYWPFAREVEWAYTADPSVEFFTPGSYRFPESDSAILVYYDLGTAGPGESPSCSLAYGLASPEGEDELQNLILALQQLEQALINRIDTDLSHLTQAHLATYRVILTEGDIPAVLEFVTSEVDLIASEFIFAESGDPSGLILSAMGMALKVFLDQVDVETFDQIVGLMPVLYQEPRMGVDDPGLEAHIEETVADQMGLEMRVSGIRVQFQEAIDTFESEGLPEDYPVEEVIGLIQQIRDRLNLTGRQEAILYWPDASNEFLNFRLSGSLLQTTSMMEQIGQTEEAAGSLGALGFWTKTAAAGGAVVKLALLLSSGGATGVIELLVGGAVVLTSAVGIGFSVTGQAAEIRSDQYHAYLALQASTAAGYELDLMEEIAGQTLQAVRNAAQQAHLWTASGQVEAVSLPDITLVEGESLAETNASVIIQNTGSQSVKASVMGSLLGDVGGSRVPLTVLGDTSGTTAPVAESVTVSFTFAGPDTALTGSSGVYTVDLWAGIGFYPIHINDDPAFVGDLRVSIARQDAADVLVEREVTVVDSGQLAEGEFSTAPLGIGTVTSVTTLELSYLGSDFDLHLYDAEGRHVGLDYQTGEIDLEIPGVSYSGSDTLPEWMRIEGYGGETLRTEVIAVSADAPEAFTLSSVQLPAMPALLGADPVVLTFSEPPAQGLTLDLLIYEYGGQAGMENIGVSVQTPGADASEVEPLTTIDVQVPSSLAASERALGQVTIPAGLLSEQGDYGADLLLEGRDSSSGEVRSVLVPIRLTVGEMESILGGVATSPGTSASPPGGGGLGIMLVVLVAVGAATWVVVLNRRKTGVERQAAAPAAFIGSSGERVALIKPDILIGRGSACDIRLAGRNVSRNHARLRFAQGSWFIQDQNSDGGTYVNGVRQAACKLEPGDRINIGDHTFQFTLASS